MRRKTSATLLVLAWSWACARPPAHEPTPAEPAVAVAPAAVPTGSGSLPNHSETRLEAGDKEPFDQLGYSLAIDGDTLVAGAHLDDDRGLETGAVYVFRRRGAPKAGWVEEAKLHAGDAVELARFGNAVTTSGELLIAGAHLDSRRGERAGAAYVFERRRGGWTQQARLEPRDGAPGQHFGQAVGLDGEVAIVGAHGDAERGQAAGAAYVFRRAAEEWRQEAKLTADDAEVFDLFGMAVAIDGELAVVGANGEDERGRVAGAAYVFRRTASGWRQEAKLIADDGTDLGELGKAVAISGDVVVTGADGSHCAAGKFCGAAYVFRHGENGWWQEARLEASDAKAADRFGNAVAIHGETILVGAHFTDDAGVGSGSAYVFTRGPNGWVQSAKLTAANAAQGEEYGNATAVAGDTLVVGALRGGSEMTAAGMVYVYEPTAQNP
ncbi:MAG: FG-GAP repeat protein [Thermoanaerobaculia bacterium]|nr:FG-GAP repeat protein [Thermoanaerobaculia bacterium]